MEWYKEYREKNNAQLKEASAFGRDIAPLPAVVDPQRKENCSLNFKLFCESYLASVFTLAWSDDHLKVISTIERAVLEGGLYAIAMSRGSGKTALTIAAAEWALLYGHRSFIVLIAATESAADDLLEHIKIDFESNDLLMEDFPEVCHPIRKLNGITHRCQGQTYNGERTLIGWTSKELIFPTIPNSKTSGSIVKVAGITGRLRGMSATRPVDGSTLRPDYCMVDDPQTDDSARSPKQVNDRLTTINGAVLGMSGPTTKISGILPCTVIQKGDVADQILDRKVFPQWQGERYSLMKSMPTNIKLWEEYAEVRHQGLIEGKGLTSATLFYLEHKLELDEGAKAAWQQRYNTDEASAIQHGMNLKFSSESAFLSEYQNQPLDNEVQGLLAIKPDHLLEKVVNIPRTVVPDYATKLVAFIDVQQNILFYCVCAFGNDFTGHVVDYGTYPEQPRVNFTLKEVSKTLAKQKPFSSFEAYLYYGLDQLTKKLGTNWKRQDGADMSISRILIDSNWGASTGIVKQFSRESDLSSIIMPSQGRGITADRKPMNEYSPRPGERPGWCWRVYSTPNRYIMFDSHSWKTFMAQRILGALGESQSLSLFKASAGQHRMFCEHAASEYPVATEGLGRMVNVWRLKANRENHYLDCLVGCMVAASEQGITAMGHKLGSDRPAKKRRQMNVSF